MTMMHIVLKQVVMETGTRKYDAAEACRMMESVRTSSTLCTISVREFEMI